MFLEAFFATVASNVFTEIFKQVANRKSLKEEDIEKIIDKVLQRYHLAGQTSVIQREIYMVLSNTGMVVSRGQLLPPVSHNLPNLPELLEGWWDKRVYKIVSVCSEKALDVPQNQVDNGITIQQWEYWGGANQQWKLISVGSHEELFKIRSQQSAKVLDVPINDTDKNGTRIQQWSYGGGMNQHWRLIPIDSTGEIFKIFSAQSGKALDVPKDMTKDGINIQQWEYWGGTNQQWRLMRVK